MAYERKPGTGVLFKNQRRKTDRHPHYTGTWYGEDGNDYWLSAWINESVKGEKYMTLALGGVKEQKQEAAPAADFDNDVPF